MPDQAADVTVRSRLSRQPGRLLTLGLAAAFIATVARRPEFAGAAAPALLLLAAGRRSHPAVISIRVKASTGRAFEGEVVAVDAEAHGTGDFSVRWTLHPGKGLDLAGASSADAAADG